MPWFPVLHLTTLEPSVTPMDSQRDEAKEPTRKEGGQRVVQKLIWYES